MSPDYIEVSGKKHQISDRNDFYKDGKFTGRFCPRCGPGIKLAQHKDRVTCGKCGYSEKQMKKEGEAPKPEPKPEPVQEAPKEEPKPEIKEEPVEENQRKKLKKN